MTMLDRMRRHRNWLKWSLGLVVLAFIIFYIPDFLGSGGSWSGGAPGLRDAVAEVEGRPITVAEFRRAYYAQLQAYRNAYGGSLNEQLLKQLGVDRQILQQLVDEQAALAEAERLGIRVSDAEVRERIVRVPAFQENGQFIGEDRYRQLLGMQNPPMTTAEFEDGMRRNILFEKLRDAVTAWITVSDVEVDREFRRRNEQVKLQLVSFPADKFREGLTATDAELAAYFDGHKEEFRIGEKRKIRFVTVDVQTLRGRVAVAPTDVERYYNDNIEQYSTPEQVRASHILLKTEGKDEAAVRAQAEQVLAEVRAGGDFAALATKYSEDDGSKANGGDLDFFGRGRMVPEFEQVAFSLQPGAVSDLVKTQYGFHIIKVVEKRAGSVRPLEEVRDQITEQLKWDRAQQQASDLVNQLAAEIKGPADLDAVAKTRGLAVQESGFFLREEPVAGIGPSPEAAAEAFSLEQGKVGQPVRTAGGYAILTVTGRQDSRLPKLDEVKDRLREAVLRQKALEAARQKALSVVASLKSAPDFEQAAKAAGLEVKATERVARGAALPDIGASPEADAAAFALTTGAVSDPVTAGSAVAILRLAERKDVTANEVTAGRDALRAEMLNAERGRFFSSYMTKAKARMNIRIDREALQRLIA